MNENLKGIKLAYIRDPLSTRVLTIASRINEDGTVTFGWSANRPNTYEYYPGPTEIIYHYKGDQFNKKLGREIALGRLSSKAAVTCGWGPDETSTEAALRFLANPDSVFVKHHDVDGLQGCRAIQRLAADELAWRERLAFKHPEWKPDTSYEAGDVVRSKVVPIFLDPYSNS